MRFTVLDGCRGAAALLVALFRFEANGHLYLSPIIQHAYLFVDFFFVLSGFVITHGYLDRVHDRSSALGFMVRRFGRLWPLHAAMLAAFVALVGALQIAMMLGLPVRASSIAGSDPFVSIFTNLLLIQSTGFFPEAAWNSPSWSISTELWAYVAFAALCLAGRRVLLAGAVLAVALGLAGVGAFSHKAMDTTFDYGMLRCLAGFFAGHLAYRVWRVTHVDLARRLPRAGFTVLEVAALVLGLGFVAIAGWSSLSLAAPLVFAVVVYVAAFERGGISASVRGPVTETLGAWSYSIYMVALLVWLLVKQAAVVVEKGLGLVMFADVEVHGGTMRLLAVAPPWVMDLAALGYVGLVLLVARFTYTRIEVPSRIWFNRWAARIEAAPFEAAQINAGGHSGARP